MANILLFNRLLKSFPTSTELASIDFVLTEMYTGKILTVLCKRNTIVQV